MRGIRCGVVLAMFCACGTQEVVLLDLPVSGPEAGPPGGGNPCLESSDCPQSYMCGKPTCGARTGRCEPLPLFCAGAPEPVCGCDRVTYWNECVRRLAKVSLASVGECFDAPALCGGKDGQKCPLNAVCTKVSPVGVCDPMEPGRCWGLPLTCPLGPSLRAHACSAAADSGNCVDVCTALKSGVPHQLAAAAVCAP